MAVASCARARPHTVGAHSTPASVTLHQGDFGSAGVIVLKDFKTFSVNSPLTFTVIERPKPGIVRVLDRAGDDAELVHLADTRAAAEAWLASHRYPTPCSMRSLPMRARRIRLKGGRHEHASARLTSTIHPASAGVLFARPMTASRGQGR
jgi:hypothetical protein